MWRFSLAALLLCAGDASAYWTRQEWIGLELRTGSQKARLIDVSAYASRWGLGVGTTALDVTMGAWDVPRRGLPDASGHGVLIYFPLKAYVALASWKGGPYFHFIDKSRADHSVGKLEAYYSYCDWGSMFQFTEVTSTILPGQAARESVPGSVRAKVIDYGLRADHLFTKAVSLTASAGYQKVTVKSDVVFREKEFDRWYGAVSYYFGATHGTDYTGGLWRMPVDVWDTLRGWFGGSTVHREPLLSTEP